MKGNVEKSIKRWLKNKVKVTLGLMVSFLITGSIGYAEEYTRIDFKNLKNKNGITFIKKEGKTYIENDNQEIEIKNNTLVIDNAKFWQTQNEFQGTGNENLIINGLENDGTIFGHKGEITNLNKFVIRSAGKGINSGYGSNVKISAKEIEINTNQSEEGSDGIYLATEGESQVIIENFDKLSIITGKAIENEENKGAYGIVANSLGSIKLKGNENSILEIISNSSEGNHGAISTGVKYSGENSEIDIETATINITVSKDIGIQNEKSNKFKIVATNTLDIKDSKKGIVNKDGKSDVEAKNMFVKSKEEGILNNGKGIINLSVNNFLIKEAGIGISVINEEEGEVKIEKIDREKEGIFKINASEKSLNVAKGEIIINYGAKDIISLSSNSDENNSYGVYAVNKGKVKITGDTLNIVSEGKNIDGANIKDDTTVTISKFGATQGIRLQDKAALDLTNVNNLNVTSSDIAVTANNANFNFNGNSYFEGNSYLVQNYTDDNLLVRPVLQAINDGNITLSGNTTVISNTGEDGAEDDAKINNVGIYAQGDTNTDMVENVTVNGNLTVISGNDVLTEKYNIKTLDELRNLTPGDFKELISNTDIALMATSGGKINIDSNENVFLIGDILSGKANSEVSVKGGNGNPDSMVVIGEVLAANGGKVNLDMSNGGYFVGRADDYFIINNEFREAGFRNNKFDENIANGGTVSIKLGDNSVWNVVGQSYVTNLEFVEGSGVVDLTHEGNALRIKNLAGEGTFNITLDSENKESGNMLYVYNVVDNIDDVQQNQKMRSAVALFANEEPATENKVITQTVNLTDSVLNLQPGEKLRFATLGDQATGKVEFVANEVKERGINNVSYNTENSAYDINDEENVVYNGDGTTATKPGNSIVNSADGFNATENWYLTRGKETINDAGKTIIEMSKANYASAVYLDNLNKRLGDMTFAEGKEGFWVRLRNDRVGEDGEYRLHNYMTQLGYDKPYPMEEGKGIEYRGIAFEISKGDMDYKNINGDANVDRQALWLYDTNMYNNGFYSDYVFRAGRMESEFDIYGRETGVKVEGTYKNLFVGASAEYGYRYDLSEKTYLEPQVQLQYTYIDGTDYTTNQETKVELDEIHSVIGRAGARLGHDFYNKEGNKTATLYAKADINHEFLGDQRVKAKDRTGVIDKKYENDGTWYDIGIGASKDVTPDFNVYMDVERQIGRTRDDQSWQFNLGFRYRFNDVKDLNPVVMLRDFTMKADNYFDFDKSELKPEGKKVVKEISNELTKENATGTLKIEGHTDSIGTNEYNQKLSERRAQSVENEFKQNITTDKIKYETRGYGEERPIADNATKEGRAKNRRVEINFGGTIEN